MPYHTLLFLDYIRTPPLVRKVKENKALVKKEPFIRPKGDGVVVRMNRTARSVQKKTSD